MWRNSTPTGGDAHPPSAAQQRAGLRQRLQGPRAVGVGDQQLELQEFEFASRPGSGADSRRPQSGQLPDLDAIAIEIAHDLAASNQRVIRQDRPPGARLASFCSGFSSVLPYLCRRSSLGGALLVALMQRLAQKIR
jgi:hypothetical protein